MSNSTQVIEIPPKTFDNWWEDEDICFHIYTTIERAKKIQPSSEAVKQFGYVGAIMELAILEFLPTPPVTDKD